MTSALAASEDWSPPPVNTMTLRHNGSVVFVRSNYVRVRTGEGPQVLEKAFMRLLSFLLDIWLYLLDQKLLLKS